LHCERALDEEKFAENRNLSDVIWTGNELVLATTAFDAAPEGAPKW
jgi:hypothetical protein